MDKKIVATPISPDPPEAPQLIVRIAGIGLIIGVVAILVGGFWSAVGPWFFGAGIIICIA